MGFLSLSFLSQVPQIEENCWSNIPRDLLNLIRSKLLTEDRVRLAATCRLYQTIAVINQVPLPLALSPCLFFSNDYKFHHPICNATIKVEFEEANNGYIRDSNYGWFLMTQLSMKTFYFPNTDTYQKLSVTDVFFYNPATKVKISVPDLPDTWYEWSLRFTSPPTSADCQIIGFYPESAREYPKVYMDVCTIKRNEKRWTVHESLVPRFFELASCKPIFCKGVHYCLGTKGGVMKFDPTTNKCSYKKPSEVIPKLLRKPNTQRYMVESDNGELLGVFVNREGGSVGVFRLNVDKMVFDERVANLGNKMLYVSNEKCYSETATVKGTENKIYLPRFHGEDSLFYSLDTNKFHTYTGYSTDNLYNEKSYERCVWIKPIFDTKCTRGFKW